MFGKEQTGRAALATLIKLSSLTGNAVSAQFVPRIAEIHARKNPASSSVDIFPACGARHRPGPRDSIDRAGLTNHSESTLEQAAHMKAQSGKRTWMLGPALAAILVLQACGPAQTGTGAKARTIYVAAVELKGGVTVDKEAYPDSALPSGGGYILKPPDDKSRWEVSTYRWDPGTIVVNVGDMVTLEIVGINGDEHPFTIEGYWITDVVRRGKITRLSFVADKPGIFKIICRKHAPSMQADLVVLAAN